MRIPGRLEITTKIGCNINCVYCPQKLLTQSYFFANKERKSELSLNDFKSCVDKLPTKTRIDFSGMAEPWLNKSCTDMVCYAAEKNFPIAIYTTLVGMTEADFEKIKNLEYEEFVLHIPDDKSNAHINITEKYIELLYKVINYKKDGIPLVTGYSCHGGIHPDIIKAIPEGSKLITDLIDRAGNLNNEYVECKQNIGEVICINCDDNVNHNVLLPDGTVVLCCMDYGLKHVLGNLLESSYEEIQNSYEANRVRNGLLGLDLDVLCRNCTNARSIHELFGEYKQFQDWNKALTKSIELKDVDLENYIDWVDNLEGQIYQLKNDYQTLENIHKARIEDLEMAKEWIENLKAQITNLHIDLNNYKDWVKNLENEIEKNKKRE